MTTYIKTKVENIEKPIALWVSLGVLALLGMTYLYFMNGFLTNTLDIRQSVVESQSLASKIADRESQYNLASLDIDESYFAEHGFKAVSEQDRQYVTVKGGPVFTFSGGL